MKLQLFFLLPLLFLSFNDAPKEKDVVPPNAIDCKICGRIAYKEKQSVVKGKRRFYVCKTSNCSQMGRTLCANCEFEESGFNYPIGTCYHCEKPREDLGLYYIVDDSRSQKIEPYQSVTCWRCEWHGSNKKSGFNLLTSRSFYVCYNQNCIAYKMPTCTPCEIMLGMENLWMPVCPLCKESNFVEFGMFYKFVR